MRKRIAIVLFLLIAAAWLVWHHNSPEPQVAIEPSINETNQSSASPVSIQKKHGAALTVPAASESRPETNPAAWIENRRKQMDEARQQGLNQWRTPIEFFGEVVDENTNPVANAEVHFVWTDLSSKGNSERLTTSDGGGLFSLRDVTGKHLIATVSKEGYYAYQPYGASFSYAGENENFVPDAAHPVIFRLKKKGTPESLVHLQAPMGGAKGFRIGKDGTPVEISLTSGKTVLSGEGDLRVECWTDDQGKASGAKYDWKCQVSVPNGGLLPSVNQFDFQAPADGYQSSDVIHMPATLENDWNSHASRNYFVKLANGNYARISFEIIAGGDHFFQVESFLNPSGSRNLEFDSNNSTQAGN